jgi:endonuclease YncB( thermonuclease family)
MLRRFFLLAAVAVAITCAADFSGKVVSITDGDTIKVMHDGGAERIRLWGIDCPESRQAFGPAGEAVDRRYGVRQNRDRAGARYRPLQAHRRRGHPARWPQI